MCEPATVGRGGVGGRVTQDIWKGFKMYGSGFKIYIGFRVQDIWIRVQDIWIQGSRYMESGVKIHVQG